MIGIDRQLKKHSFRMQMIRHDCIDIFLRFIQEPTVLDSRIRRGEKEKRSGPYTEINPDRINKKIDCIKTPVLPVKKPDKKRSVKEACLLFHFRPSVFCSAGNCV